MWETHAEADPVLNYKYLCTIYQINILFLNKVFKKNYFFCLFAVDTNQKVHRFCNPTELTAYFKMYFERERFNPLLGENLLKEYRYSLIFR